ncbi:MAG: single-stranded DNA-binding protein [Eggerthellaceae bacterium]|nr:single-stranded DNA-binding protein [Eggerthellaceae bacterium]
MSINIVSISGNLGAAPTLRQTQSGMSVLGFSVCVNDRRKNQQTGEWEDVPNWIDCTMFGTRAQSLSQYLQKGTKVSIEGKLRWSQWERDGQKRSKIEVIVDELVFMSTNERPAAAPAYQQPPSYASQPNMAPQAAPQPVYAQQQGYAPQQYAQPQYAQPAMQGMYDEDIPF